METQKIVNLLNNTDNESSNFAARKWYVINDQNNTEYGEGNENDSSMKFEIKIIRSGLCDYSDGHILLSEDITFMGINADTTVAFENGAPFKRCIIHINDKHLDTAENFAIIKPMYNLIEYSDNYSDTSGSSWQFKRDESPINNAGNPINVAVNNSSLFKYKSSLLGKPAADGNNRVLKTVKIINCY